MKNAAVRIFLLLTVVVFLSACYTIQSSTSSATATDGLDTNNVAPNATPSAGDNCPSGTYQCNGQYIQKCDGTQWVDAEYCKTGCTDGKCNEGSYQQPSPEQIALIECEYQCTTNAKACQDLGWDPAVCDVEINKCFQQCPETGKPTEALPPPTNPYVPPVPPQPSPELIQCKSTCETKAKNCVDEGIDPNICKQEHVNCNTNCEEQYPLQTVVQETSFSDSQLLDYGDAPDPSFPSRKASNGSRHIHTDYEWLGFNVTTEDDSLQINLDQRDDGLNASSLYGFYTCFQKAVPIVISVRSRNDLTHPYNNDKLLYLNMLFDWDNDGVWSGQIDCGPGETFPEHAVVNYPINVSAWPPGVTTKVIIIPVGAGGSATNKWVRAMLTYDQKVNFPWNGQGEFSYGETEDYGPPPPRDIPPRNDSNNESSGDNETGDNELNGLNQAPLPIGSGPIIIINEANELGGCQNNSECGSNNCDNGICKPSPEQPVAQQKITISSIIQVITKFFNKLLGRS